MPACPTSEPCTTDSPVLNENLVELGRGDKEEDRRYRVEALEPLLALRALSAHVHEPERNVVDGDDELRDAFGGLPRVQDVLVGGNVFLQTDSAAFSY